MAFKDPAGANARGRARQAELAAENETMVRELVAGLLQSLGRQPIAAELVAAELVARTVVKIRRLAERGRDDIAERELLQRLMVSTPFGMVPAPPPVPRNLDVFAPRPPGAPRPQYRVAERGETCLPPDTAPPTDG